MTAARPIAELLAAVQRGDLDALTPAEVARLEAVLNDDPALADKLADVPAAGPMLPDVAPPPVTAWERVWQDVELASAPRARRPRYQPVWAAAAAAIVLMIGWWQLDGGRARTSWTLRPDPGVEILALESFGTTTPLVMSTGGDGDFPVIWIMDNPGQGA